MFTKQIEKEVKKIKDVIKETEDFLDMMQYQENTDTVIHPEVVGEMLKIMEDDNKY